MNGHHGADPVTAAVATLAKDYEIPDEPGHFEELAAECEALGAAGASLWSRRELRHVRDFARARRAAPLAVLGVVLARAAAAVEPNVVLPPLVGAHASLNLFVALTGQSGGGKGAAEAAAGDAVEFLGHDGFTVRTDCFPPGSGEGIARTFARRPDGTGTAGAPPRRTRALFSAPEVDTLAALGGRRGSTLMPELRKVYSGEQLGFKNAAEATTATVAAHSYRACLVVGVQPAKAAALLDDADGGTPQRFVWLPVDDPDAPDATPGCPEPLRVRLPRWAPAPHREVLQVPGQAAAAITGHRLAVLRGEADTDPLDGHALLCQLKVAAALMVLAGRSTVNGEDWDIAAALMRASADTRARARAVLSDRRRRANRARAHDDADRALVVQEKVGKTNAEKVRGCIVDKLARVESASKSELSAAVRGSLRAEWFGPVFAEMLDTGQIVPTGRNRKGNDVYALRL